MYKQNSKNNLLFFDCETIPEVSFSELSAAKKKIWLEKYHFKHLQEENDFQEKRKVLGESFEILPNDERSFEKIYNKYSPLHFEFCKIWCISFGVFTLKNEIDIYTSKEDSEKDTLQGFLTAIDRIGFELAGFNIAGFDIPLIINRCFTNGIFSLPKQLRLKDAKPWTTSFVDLMIDWKGLSWSQISLGLLCEVLGVKTPKDKFENHEFTTLLLNGKITEEDGIEYCEKDVRAVMECYVKLESADSNYEPEKEVKKWKK